MKDLSERQRRELEFYEEFSKRNPRSGVSFASISGKTRKSWNSYWHVMEIAKQNFTSEDQKLLDFGCGCGESSIIFTRIGYEVFGFDISPNNIETARRLAVKYEMTERAHFQVGVAEELDYPDEFFDAIIGTDILHHVDIPRALSECSRVLKPGGVAIFHEPVRVALFDDLRESRFGRWLVPKEVSIERHVTEDERKLTAQDLEFIKSFGSDSSIQHFLLFSRLDRFIRFSKTSSFLEKIDFHLLKPFPFLRPFGGVVIIVVRK